MRGRTTRTKPSAWRKRGGRVLRDTRDSSSLLARSCHAVPHEAWAALRGVFNTGVGGVLNVEIRYFLWLISYCLQTPPDLVVKFQPIDIVGFIL